MTTFDPYGGSLDVVADLAGTLLSGFSAIACCNQQGEILCATPKLDDMDRTALGEVVSQLNAKDDTTHQVMPNGKRWSTQRLAGTDGDVMCLMHGAQDDEEQVRTVLRAAAPVMQRCAALDQELATMTDELVRRYEELNLVYNTEEALSSNAEGERVLINILDNCTDALEVDVAAIVLRDHGRSLVRCRESDHPPDNIDTLLNRKAFAAWLPQQTSAVVLNSVEERWQFSLSCESSEKIIVCPLLDNQSHYYGSIVVVNDESRRDFENSDRNLVAVLAEKAARVVSVKYDSLTGLLTRDGFERHVATAMREVTTQQRQVCLMHINVDQMKLVNDTFSHDVGDSLLQKVANILKAELRPKDALARLGGDDFAILMPDIKFTDALSVADRICQKTNAIPCRVGARQLDVSLSFGVARVSGQCEDVVEAMAQADLACNVAKEEGRARVAAYREDDQLVDQRKDQMEWIGRVQRSIKTNGFVLYSQLIAPTVPGKSTGHYEVLLRMLGDDGEVLAPGYFMPVAERYHIMPNIDRWVVSRAIEMLGDWSDAGQATDAVFAINLSGQSLTDPRTLAHLLTTLASSRFDTSQLCFEITETAAISNLEEACDFIEKVKGFGCKFALDDFGAGVSSFTNLRALQLDYLKIDGSFVVDMLTDEISASMVAAINQVGQTMKLETVAEFVESSDVADALAALGVDYLQGYHLGKPLALSEQLASLARDRVRTA